jgi:hypothetical protein
MAIKSGQVLHVGNDAVLVERLQTAGPGALNIPKEKIFELGNYKSVATIRDVPDLTYSLESLDTTVSLEAMLTRTAAGSASFDLSTCKPLDLATPFKPGKDAPTPFTITQAVGIPYLYPESISYRFGLKDNATQTVSLRGDSIFYCPGPVYVQEQTTAITAGGSVVTTNVAGQYTDSSGTRRVLSVTVGNDRLSYGTDYTVTSAGSTPFEVATVNFKNAVASGVLTRIMYFSNVTRDYLQSVHTSATVKPAAIRGRDIEVWVGGYDPTDPLASDGEKWGTVQSANVDWRVTLEPDEEFGNYYRIGQDFEVPEVTGTITIKPKNVADFFTKLRTATGVSTATAAIGPNLAALLPLDIVIKNPADGATLKRINVPDARFTLPGFSPRVQQKLTVELPFDSDGGQLFVYPE